MQKEIISRHQLEVTLQRLACQLVENHRDFSSTVIVGIQRRGVVLAQKLGEILCRDYGIKDLKIGTLDVTFFRDDFRRRESPAHANTTSILFPVDNQKVVFVDDVLHTGRTQRAALSAINSFGRPSKIELLVLIHRRYSRQLPIQPDYKGIQVDVAEGEKVIVDVTQGNERVYIEEI
ncbi:MAG: bifunctional pyr operon transcriptional regulator/uracil phosphoribosyltransferase PyrR [Flavobacteriales bacterium]|nr:bifunctional pyr operon transcriptional regulator/uracil phosphoribosyltransferase PyrR [Flavobacteriales bacterium]MBQ8649874.1 bifunctional pyr operon transcriptional regulator/uracil phosphoribosyltransferase PyrR [Flavobacteriales bacterium]